MARRRYYSGRRSTPTHLKSMGSYELHAWRDAMAIAALVDERIGAARARSIYARIPVEEVWKYEDATEGQIAEFVGRSESQRPSMLRKLPQDEVTQVCFLTLGILGCVRVMEMMELRDRYAGYLVPGFGNRQTVGALYRFCQESQTLFDYAWPSRVFAAIESDDEYREDYEDEEDEEFAKQSTSTPAVPPGPPLKPTVPPPPPPPEPVTSMELLVKIGGPTMLMASPGSDQAAWKLQVVQQECNWVGMVLLPEEPTDAYIKRALKWFASLSFGDKPTLLGLPKRQITLVEELNREEGRTIAGVLRVGAAALAEMKWPENLLEEMKLELAIVGEPMPSAHELVEMDNYRLATEAGDPKVDWEATRRSVEGWVRTVLAHRGRWIGPVEKEANQRYVSVSKERDLAKVRRKLASLEEDYLTPYGTAFYQICQSLLAWRSGELDAETTKQHVARAYLECCWYDVKEQRPAYGGSAAHQLSFELNKYFGDGSIEMDVLEAGVMDMLGGELEANSWGKDERDARKLYPYEQRVLPAGWFSAWWCALEIPTPSEIGSGGWLPLEAKLVKAIEAVLPGGVRVRVGTSLAALELVEREEARTWVDGPHGDCLNATRNLVFWLGGVSGYMRSHSWYAAEDCKRWGLLVAVNGPTQESVAKAREAWPAAAKAIKACISEGGPKRKSPPAPRSLRVSPEVESFLDPLIAKRERLALLAGWKWDAGGRCGIKPPGRK